MSTAVLLPVLLPLLAGALSLALWRSPVAQRAIAVGGTGALLAASVWLLAAVRENGVLVMQMGNWPAPFGITFAADLLGAIMVLLAAITGFAVALYSLASIGSEHEHYGYYPLFHLLLAGVAGAFLTGDVFNLYVWIEVLLVASFALLILGGERAQMEGAIKYVTLNLISSLVLLTAIGLLYGVAGTLNMADLALKLHEVEDTGLLVTISLLFLVAFSIKAAAFPLFFWLPASYHTPQVAVSALFAGLLTKVGIYALFRFFTLMFDQDVGFTHHTLLAWVAGLTLITGILGALVHTEFRRVLSFILISHVGFILMGLALMSPLGLTGGIFYLLHDVIVKANLFLIAGVVFFLKGSFSLERLGGLYRSRPFLALLFLVPALSLIGIPPLSGFYPKLMLVQAGLVAEMWWLTAAALVASLLTLLAVMRLWGEVFWKAAPEDNPGEAVLAGRQQALLYAPIIGLATLTLAIGFIAQPVYELAAAAAAQLLDSSDYIAAVLPTEVGP
ncbi:MAG: Na+/H+ antiporter subunit D [Pseudomonadota bacterium]